MIMIVADWDLSAATIDCHHKVGDPLEDVFFQTTRQPSHDVEVGLL